MTQAPRAPRQLPKAIETHDELVAHLPVIFGHLNDHPALARLLLVNPLLVFEDLGIRVADELAEHVQKTLGLPPARVEQIVRARRRVRELLAKEFPAHTPALPQGPKARADLLLERLKLEYPGARPTALTVEQLRPLRTLHPLADALYELGRLERGAFQYLSRGEFERYKAGAPHHSWITGIHFQKGT